MDEASFLFDPQQLRTYNIIIAEADLASINAQPSSEKLVPAMLEFEGHRHLRQSWQVLDEARLRQHRSKRALLWAKEAELPLHER
jgi:hypothetical protein